VFSALGALGIGVRLKSAKPFKLEDDRPFEADAEHASYEEKYVHRW
jgi:hypothetical protein